MVRARDIATAAVVLTVGAAAGLGGVAGSGPADPASDAVGAAHLLDGTRATRSAAAATAPGPSTPRRRGSTPAALPETVDSRVRGNDGGDGAPAPARVVLETLVGSASYYANSLAGRRTASGERYDPREMVAAHRTLPFGSLLRVTNEANGRSVQVRVVDRGPFARGRVLDLSRRAAEELDFIRQGHTRVTIEVLEQEGDGA